MRGWRLPRVPLELFLWTRAAIWLGTLFLYMAVEGGSIPPFHPVGTPLVRLHDVGWGVDVWARWDSGWYLDIVHHGYADPLHTTAFFPAYPLLVRGVGWAFGGHDIVAGVVVSLAACLGAFVLLYALVRDRLGEDVARRAVLYLALFPTALFLGAVYSESLYLLFSVAAFYAATRGRWLPAGIATGLAILTRIAGVVLLPALAILAWRAPNRRRAFAGLAASLPLGAVWPAWLWAAHGRPFLFMTAEREGWQRHLSPAGPFGGLWDGFVAGWKSVHQLFTHTNLFPNVDDGLQAAAMNLEALAATLLILALGVYVWRRLGAAYGVFVLGSVALPLASPGPTFPLLSMPRFALGVFPIFVGLALLGGRARTNVLIVALSSLLLGIEIARWIDWQPVG
jgi:4-amino-4-deoxy-L-arabinose transferase-like glycosyltransferase